MDSLDKIPPQSLDAEKSLIGAVLLDKEAMLKIGDVVDVDDFYKDGHSKIYEIMMELYEKNEPIDLLTVSNRLNEKGWLEKCGGQEYLANLANSVPTSAHAAKYAHIIHQKATRRRLIMATQEILKLGYDEGGEIEQVLDNAQRHLFGVSKNYLRQNFFYGIKKAKY